MYTDDAKQNDNYHNFGGISFFHKMLRYSHEYFVNL